MNKYPYTLPLVVLVGFMLSGCESFQNGSGSSASSPPSRTVTGNPPRAVGDGDTARSIGAAQASAHIGEQVAVIGVVGQVSVRPSMIFLNFDKRYPDNPFTAIIRSNYTNEFENLAALEGKSVSVRGKVIDHNGRAEMELTGKSQLKILGETN